MEVRPEELLGTNRGLLSQNTNQVSIKEYDVSSISELSQPNIMSPVSSQHAERLSDLNEEKFKGLRNSEPKGKTIFWSPAGARGLDNWRDSVSRRRKNIQIRLPLETTEEAPNESATKRETNIKESFFQP